MSGSLAPSPAPAAMGESTGRGFLSDFGHQLLAEWTKIRSLRSTVWALVLLFVLTLGLTTLFTSVAMAQWNQLHRDDRASLMGDPVSGILGSGLLLGQLTICVLGVLVISSEYSTGMIRSSLLAEPRRWPMLVAKCSVFAVLVFIVGEIVGFVSFFVGAAILHAHVTVTLSDPGVLRAVIGEGLYLAVLGLFALAIGGLLRHTAGAITVVIGFIIVLSPLTQVIPGNVGIYLHAYMPAVAGSLITSANPAISGDNVLSPWQGFGVFCLWTAVLLAISAYLLQRRDA